MLTLSFINLTFKAKKVPFNTLYLNYTSALLRECFTTIRTLMRLRMAYFRTLFQILKNKAFTPYLSNIVYMALFFYN